MRIMAQKSAAPSAWTRQKEVITSSPATIVLEENAKKAKAEVAMIADALADIDEGMGRPASFEAAQQLTQYSCGRRAKGENRVN